MSKQSQDAALSRQEACLSEVHFWFCLNGLALNPDKTDVISLGTTQRAKTLSPISTISVAGTPVSLFSNIKILGVTLNNTLSFDNHVSYLSRSCYYHIRALHHIRPSISEDVFKIQDDCLLNGRLSSGLRKFCVPWRFSQGCIFSQGCTRTRTHPEQSGHSSNSSTWPNQYLSDSPKEVLAACQMEDQLQGCYTDIQSPRIRRIVISFVENRYRRCKSITTIIV